MSNYIEKSSIKYGEVEFETSRIRTVEEDGQLHFCLADCLKAVGTSTGTNKIKWDDEMGSIKFYPCLDSLGRQQVTKFVTEAGLYELLEKVNLSEADKTKSERVLRFRSKLNNEILPSIRKHGAYIDEDRAAVTDEQMALMVKMQNLKRSELFRLLAETEEARENALVAKAEWQNKCSKQATTIREQDNRIERLENRILAQYKDCPKGFKVIYVREHFRLVPTSDTSEEGKYPLRYLIARDRYNKWLATQPKQLELPIDDKQG